MEIERADGIRVPARKREADQRGERRGPENARALRALDALFRPMDETSRQRRKDDHRRGLSDLQRDVAQRHAATPAGTACGKPPKRILNRQ
jgi:hypothetical protein